MKDIETLTDLVRGYKELGCNGWVIDYLNRYINGGRYIGERIYHCTDN